MCLTLVGGAATGGRAAIEVRLLAGWGVACLVLTFWGILTPWSLATPGWLLLAGGPASLAVGRWRPSPTDLAGAGRILALSLPLFLLLASVRPALPDTFLNLLPNAAYLVDFGRLPASDAARTISIFPALPYNTQFVVYLASLVTGSLPESGLVFFNLMVQIAGGLFFARLIATGLPPEPERILKSADDSGRHIRGVGWWECALGLALVTALNPGFMPKLAFSSMGEPSTEITLAVAAGLLLGALPARSVGRACAPASVWLTQAALVLLAFINVRQSNIGLFAALLAGLGALVLLDRSLRSWRIATRLLLAFSPAMLLYLGWRSFVVDHFVEGELKLLPLPQWQWDSLPRILGAIGQTMLHRPFLYGCFVLAVAGVGLEWRRRPWGDAARAGLLLVFVAAGYNGFLIFTYVAHFASADDPAHSYYRYTSHMGPLLVLALTLCALEAVRRRPAGIGRLHAGAGRLAIVLALLLPFAFVAKLRFDLVQPQPIVWDMVKRFAPELAGTTRLGLVLPGDNGTVSLHLRGYLALTAPRRSDLDTMIVAGADPASLAALAGQGYDTVLVSCASGTPFDGTAPEAVLARFSAGRWDVVDRYTYPPLGWAAWDPVMAAAPLCGSPAPSSGAASSSSSSDDAG